MQGATFLSQLISKKLPGHKKLKDISMGWWWGDCYNLLESVPMCPGKKGTWM